MKKCLPVLLRGGSTKICYLLQGGQRKTAAIGGGGLPTFSEF